MLGLVGMDPDSSKDDARMFLSKRDGLPGGEKVNSGIDKLFDACFFGIADDHSPIGVVLGEGEMAVGVLAGALASAAQQGVAIAFDDQHGFSTSEMFENGQLSIYAEWLPTDAENDFQEVVGHYNWELLQEN